ncbi:MAG: tRNA 2-thiouridine(34) synthase MnmA [Zetaproteobacteria bacterium]|nr:MAG: tRNA 2-thiouridine(34) synthase MnmA [Zetaproteobacteria bacterium]
MSGGVDSSVAAALVQAAGAEPIGVFMHLWDYPPDGKRYAGCCSLDDAFDARRVAEKLDIPFYTLDMRDPFRKEVVRPFAEAFIAGRTPNPCAHCNRFVKFGALLELADRMGVRWIATGHYVRRSSPDAPLRLFCGADPAKDQSYFLATTPKEALSRVVFPVGSLAKEATRAIAAFMGLPTARKAESQDVCFIPNGDRAPILKRMGGEAALAAGEIVHAATGEVLGRHRGTAYYTIGQRRGLGLSRGPWKVVRIDPARARVEVLPAEAAKIRAVRVQDWVWFRRPERDEALSVKLRYRMQPAPCAVRAEEGAVAIELRQPEEPTAPGQVAALYAGEELLGGGVVEAVEFA